MTCLSSSARIAAEQSDFHRQLSSRQKYPAGDSSEYYGVPLLNSEDKQVMAAGKSQPTSPSNRNSRHNYETSRSIPRSYKRHEGRQPTAEAVQNRRRDKDK